MKLTKKSRNLFGEEKIVKLFLLGMLIGGSVMFIYLIS
jgi:hypothetical protein